MEPRVCESSRTSWSSWPHWKPSTLFKANAPTPSNSAVACKVQVKLFPVPFGGGGINVSFAPYLRGNGTTLTSHRGTSHSSAHRRRSRLDGDVQKAVDMGYTVLHMYKVWHFPESSMELYSNYINK